MDPNRLLFLVLMPLLTIDAVLWQVYVGKPMMTALFVALLVVSIGLYRRSGA